MKTADAKALIENRFQRILNLCKQNKYEVFGEEYEIRQGLWSNEAGVVVGFFSLLSPAVTKEPLEFVLQASPLSDGFELSADICTSDGCILMTVLSPYTIKTNSTQAESNLSGWFENARLAVPNLLVEMQRIAQDYWNNQE